MALPNENMRRQADQDAALALALGDPERIAILRALSAVARPLSLAGLAAASSLDVPTVSAHIAVLVSAGVVTRANDSAGASFRITETSFGHALRVMVGDSIPADAQARDVYGVVDAILGLVDVGVALYDAAGHTLQVNPAGERITGRAVRLGESTDERIERYGMRDADGRPIAAANSPSGRALCGEVISRMECIITSQDGQDTWLRCSSAPLRDTSGVIQGAVVIFDDITEQRMLGWEEARQRGLAAAMIEHTFSGMAIFDVSDAFRCIRHNDNFLTLMGDSMAARGNLVGLSLDELFEGEADDMGARVRAIFEYVRATGEPYFLDEFSVVLPYEQRRRWYRWRLTALRDGRGNIIGLLNVVFEITELVQAREASKRYASELRAVIDAMPDAVVLTDSQGFLALNNAAVTSILGHPFPADVPVSMYGETFACFAEDGRRLATEELPLVRALQGEIVVAENLIYLRPDGNRVDLLISAAPVDFDDSGQSVGAVTVFQDITPIRELERQRDDFLGIAAHELRTPLATILATAQAFQRRLQNRPDGQTISVDALTSGMERIYRQVQRLNKLVTDLLDATRIRTGKLMYDLEPCDFVAAIREAIDGQITANPGRKIALTLPKHPVMVMGDAFRLSQVVDNLVANALKYSGDGQPVSVTLKVNDGFGRLHITDKGVGIPQENLEHLFDRFYRVPGIDVQSGAGVGLGLGLHISLSVIERHGGRIEVHSTPGKGSRFTVILPLLEDQNQHSA